MSAYQRRDYCYKKVGWRWVVLVGHDNEYVGVPFLRFWRWKTAARVAGALFAAYHDGRDAERVRRRERGAA